MVEKERIEKEVLARKGPWVFDEKVSLIFEDHIRKSIPCYDSIQTLIGLISQEFLTEDALIYDLGTATGEVIVNIERYNGNKNLRYIGIDNSAAMLEKAKIKCAGIRNASFIHNDITEVQYRQANLFVSAFTFQFISVEKRLTLLKKIKSSLRESGYFIFCEKICCEKFWNTDVFQRLYEKWKLKYFTEEEIKAKTESLTEIMTPISKEKNI